VKERFGCGGVLCWGGQRPFGVRQFPLVGRPA